MIRRPRPYWGSANYRKPKRTTKTFSRSHSNHGNSNRYEHDDGHRDRSTRSKPRVKVPDDGRQRVRRCVNCEHFSNNLRSCNQCGTELRENARVFLNPEEVRSVFEHFLESVTNMGPDFMPMKIDLDDGKQQNRLGKSSSETLNVRKFSTSITKQDVGADGSSNSNLADDIKMEAETVSNVITIDSDNDLESDNQSQSSEFENSKCERRTEEMEANDARRSHIKDEDATDLVTQMQTADCPPNTNYFVKKCCRCQTYSFDLQKCETCNKKISPSAEIILHQSISRRKIKSDEWRKAKYHLIQQERRKVPIPVQLCNMDMVNKMIARGGSKNPNKTGKKSKKKGKSKRQTDPGSSCSGNDAVAETNHQ